MTLTISPEQKTRIAIVATTVLAFGGVVVNRVLVVSARATHQMDIYGAGCWRSALIRSS